MLQTTRTIGANVMENPLECATHKKGHNSGRAGEGKGVLSVCYLLLTTDYAALSLCFS